MKVAKDYRIEISDMIKEVIIVEGRDDEDAVKKAVDAVTIATHGYGIKKSTIELIRKAEKERGIIIFTDPDHAGEQIRERLTGMFPKAGHAYLPREEAKRDGDIGIENASPASIQRALSKARYTVSDYKEEFTQEDLRAFGLAGGTDAAAMRNAVGAILGIGYGNAKVFLRRLNQFGIRKEEFTEAWTSCTHREPFPG